MISAVWVVASTARSVGHHRIAGEVALRVRSSLGKVGHSWVVVGVARELGHCLGIDARDRSTDELAIGRDVELRGGTGRSSRVASWDTKAGELAHEGVERHVLVLGDGKLALSLVLAALGKVVHGRSSGATWEAILGVRSLLVRHGNLGG